MRFKVLTKRKKNGGHYYIVVSDSRDMFGIWGRFKSMKDAIKRKHLMERKYE